MARTVKTELVERITGKTKEPNGAEVVSLGSFVAALTYYSQNKTRADSKRWAIDWAKKNGVQGYEKLRGVHEYDFSNMGFVCRLFSNGMKEFDAYTHERAHSFLSNLVDSVKPEKPKEAEPIKKVDTKPKTRHNPDLYALDEALDRVMDTNRVPNLILSGVGINAREVKEYLVRYRVELLECPEFYDKKTLPTLKKFVDKTITACDSIIGATVRKARKKTPTQLVAKVRCLKELTEFNIKAMPTEKIIGATKIVAYDTKTRKVIIFVSDNQNGFEVKTSKLTNVDMTKSVSRVVRKPSELFDVQINMRALTKKYKEQKTVERPASDRLTDTMILLCYT